MYERAIELIKTAPGVEGDLVRHFILGYVAYSFARIGEVTPEADGIHGIDRVMSSGFSWLPPSGWVDLFGGVKETVAMIEKAGLTAPAQLKGIKDKGKICRVADVSKFLIGR